MNFARFETPKHTQIFQKPSIEVGSLNHTGVPIMLEGTYLH